MATYYKTTKRNGMSFHGNVKYAVGKTVRKKKSLNPQLCTPTVLHASAKALDALSYAGILDCNLYEVEGQAVIEDDRKSGFFSLTIVREVPDSEKDQVFGFKFNEALHPINPASIRRKVSAKDIENLKLWASVRDSVGASVRASVRASVWDSVWASVGASVWDSVRASVWAYVGSLFPYIVKWQHIEHAKGIYPFQPAVDLWKRGFIPIRIDGTWKLYHPVKGKPAICVYEGEGVR